MRSVRTPILQLPVVVVRLLLSDPEGRRGVGLLLGPWTALADSPTHPPTHPPRHIRTVFRRGKCNLLKRPEI